MSVNVSFQLRLYAFRHYEACQSILAPMAMICVRYPPVIGEDQGGRVLLSERVWVYMKVAELLKSL